MNSLSQEEDFIYGPVTLLFMKMKRLHRRLTKKRRLVNVKVDIGEMPPPERQYIPSRKWKYFINLNFQVSLPQVDWDFTGAFNKLLLTTESDGLLIGVYFITIKTDDPWKYDLQSLAEAACQAFGLHLGSLEVTSSARVSDGL